MHGDRVAVLQHYSADDATTEACPCSSLRAGLRRVCQIWAPSVRQASTKKQNIRHEVYT